MSCRALACVTMEIKLGSAKSWIIKGKQCQKRKLLIGCRWSDVCLCWSIPPNSGRSKIQCMKAFWEKMGWGLYLLRPQDILNSVDLFHWNNCRWFYSALKLCFMLLPCKSGILSQTYIFRLACEMVLALLYHWIWPPSDPHFLKSDCEW